MRTMTPAATMRQLSQPRIFGAEGELRAREALQLINKQLSAKKKVLEFRQSGSNPADLEVTHTSVEACFVAPPIAVANGGGRPYLWNRVRFKYVRWMRSEDVGRYLRFNSITYKDVLNRRLPSGQGG